MIGALLSMYVGFGIGMCITMVSKNKILYRGFLIGQEVSELTQFQYCLFIVSFCLLWPLRFFPPVNEAFRIENKETGDVLPM